MKIDYRSIEESYGTWHVLFLDFDFILLHVCWIECLTDFIFDYYMNCPWLSIYPPGGMVRMERRSLRPISTIVIDSSGQLHINSHPAAVLHNKHKRPLMYS